MAKEKFYSLYGKAVDKDGQTHYVTVVGKMTQTKETETIPQEMKLRDVETNKNCDALVFINVKKKVRTFTMARAICDPRDTFNFEVGVELAKRRIERGETIGTQYSEDVTMLNDDQCNMLVFTEVNHIINHIDDYVSK